MAKWQTALVKAANLMVVAAEGIDREQQATKQRRAIAEDNEEAYVVFPTPKPRFDEDMEEVLYTVPPIPPVPKINLFDESTGFGKTYTEAFTKFIESINDKIDKFDKAKKREWITGKAKEMAKNNASPEEIESFLNDPDIEALLPYLPTERINRRFTAEKQWEIDWDLQLSATDPDYYRKYFIMMVDTYAKGQEKDIEAIETVMGELAQERIAAQEEVVKELPGYQALLNEALEASYKNLLDNGYSEGVQKEGGTTLKYKGISLDYYLGLAKGVSKFLEENFMNGNASLADPEAFKEFLMLVTDSLADTLADENVNEQLVGIENVRGYLAHNTGLGKNKPQMEVAKEVLENEARAIAEKWGPAAGVENENAYEIVMGSILEALKTTRIFDFDGEYGPSSNNITSPVGVLASEGASDVLPLKGNAEMLDAMGQAGVRVAESLGPAIAMMAGLREQAGALPAVLEEAQGHMNLEGTAEMDVSAAMEASSALQEVLADTSGLDKQARGWRKYSEAAEDADEENRSAAKGFGALASGAGATAALLGKLSGGLKETAKTSGEAGDGVKQFAAQAAKQVAAAGAGMAAALKTVKPHMNPSGKATLDVGNPLAGVAAMIAAGGAMGAAMAKIGASTKKAGSSSRRRAAEAAAAAAEAARAAEEARKEAIRKAYQQVEHKKHLNQISLEDELAMLEKIRKKHKLNAEEIMEWEEKVYDVKKAIRERDSGSVDKLGDGVIEALRARYEAMRDAEMERLDSSREAWEKWRDDSVKAIEDQIDALDKLAEAEDREKQDAEELRKIGKLRQEIEFEQDEYNQMKLQQQLDQAIESREERLRRLALQDEKEALREEIKGIEEQADGQLKAIEEERKGIQEAYEERLKNAAIRAEAERMLMSDSQEEIIALLAEFAPDYDALGKTLGEKLLEGFTKKAGNIVDWFKAFNESLVKLQEGAAAEALASADAFLKEQQSRMSAEQAVPGSTVVNQTVNFNEPMETPGQAARRLAQANEDMAGLIYG